MSLIKSISGIRGTIGGKSGEGLGGTDIVKFAAAYAQYIKETIADNGDSPVLATRIVVGRDARISGVMVEHLVVGTLLAMGMDVVNIGMATTPTTELAVTGCHASHNPGNWNALKLLDSNGEFLSDAEGKRVIGIAENEAFTFADVDALGKETVDTTWLDRHIEMVCGMNLVNREAIAKAGFKVAVDAVNSIGGVAVPRLLKALGVKDVCEINCEPSGRFAHNPEPIPANLTQISEFMVREKADVGFCVDPDVDRLAIVMENGEMFIEENTLIAVADYVLSKTPGNTVSNLSSSRGLPDVTQRHGCCYSAAAVGEVNVVAKMKETGAVIGGEGNGGVIYPELHYGRDALVGVALFLSLLAERRVSVSALKDELPRYFIAKNKVTLTDKVNVDEILSRIKEVYKHEDIIDIDGVKINFKDSWVHLRKSNTEPIIRIYSEAPTMDEAQALFGQINEIVLNLIG